MLVTSVGIATTTTGLYSGIGTFNIIGVDRAALGTLAASHNNGVQLVEYFLDHLISLDLIYSLQMHQEEQIILIEIYQILKHHDQFSKEEHILRKTYTNNRIFDDLSTEFTGVGATFRMKVGGANVTGITTGSSLVLINGIFQKPTTDNNLSNNYVFVGVGTTAQNIEFTGISSFGTNNQIISETDINQNRLTKRWCSFTSINRWIRSCSISRCCCYWNVKSIWWHYML